VHAGKKVIKNPVPLLIAAAYAVAYAMYNSKSWLKPASLVMLTPVVRGASPYSAVCSCCL